MDRHIKNIQSFGQTVIVCFNRYATDTEEEIDFLRQHCKERGVGFVVNNAYNEGGEGAVELAKLVVDTIEKNDLYVEETEDYKKSIEDILKR